MRRVVSVVLLLVIATGGTVYTRPDYHHLVEASRARREGWGKCKAEIARPFRFNGAEEACTLLAFEAGERRSPAIPSTRLVRPSALERRPLRPPIAPAPIPA